MNILAVDTSCDETSASVVSQNRVLSNVVSSQVRFHKKYGGVVPFLAQRLHKERINAVIKLSLGRAGVSLDGVDFPKIDALAVTVGPGLAPALEVGIARVCELASEYNLPVYPVNHMAGHMASCFAQIGSKNRPERHFPALAVLVSGGHSEFVVIEKWGQWKLIGQTLDDALGEAYDKLAKMLGLGYPGGKIIDRLAQEGNSERYPLPVPMSKSGDFNLSYSGLKNASRLLILELSGSGEKLLSAEEVRDVCAAFQKVAQESLLIKLERILVANSAIKQLWLGGGVAANMPLRQKARTVCKKFGIELAMPAQKRLCTDNAAMIGVAAWFNIESGSQPVAIPNLDRQPGLLIG